MNSPYSEKGKTSALQQPTSVNVSVSVKTLNMMKVGYYYLFYLALLLIVREYESVTFLSQSLVL